ncbi:maleylpyruvate isomerase family mycothiol-dependent enzyme [Nocardioides dilutus]
MPTSLTPEQHLGGLREAVAAFVGCLGRSEPAAPVPTCPDWTLRDLVAHQGMVHRWAAALVRGERPDDADVAAFETEGRASGDLAGWLREGALEVARAVTQAPADLVAPVFLNDAPPPRAFWARRQCHETTIHAVDALSASLGRPPRPDETWIDPVVALDGIDELLGGFLARPRSRLRCEEEALLVVAPDDAPEWWEVALGPDPAVVSRHLAAYDAAVDPDWEVTGSAVELYLRLWNRSAPAGPEDGDWRQLTAVRWG